MTKISFLLMLFLLPSSALCEACKFEYWEVIPSSSECDVMHLPDFDFRKLPKDPADTNPVARFCTQYEARSASAVVKSGFCYTGEGDRSGPTFKIAGQEYLADVSFQGCVEGKERQGIVFAPEGWLKAPKRIQRFWPVSSLPKKLHCPLSEALNP
jgi:hypothetical protein